MPTVNEALFDASVKHQIYLQRLSSKTVREILETLVRSEQDILSKLANAEITDFSERRLKAMLAEIRILTKEAYAVLYDQLDGKLSSISQYESEFTANLIEKLIPVEITLVRPSVEILRAIIETKPLAGRFIGDEVKDLSADTVTRIEQALRIGMVEGETTPEIVRRIRGTKALNYKDGLLQRSRDDVERLVRTSVTHVTARARDELYQSNADLVKGWRFVATLDSRTSKICISLDGTAHNLNTGPMPPRHPNCRSTTSPILKSWQELGGEFAELPEATRASMDGQVPESLTYQQWLKKQPREFVEDVLGKTKAKLFLDGNLSVDKFFDFSGQELTLDALKKTEAKLFAKLQI